MILKNLIFLQGIGGLPISDTSKKGGVILDFVMYYLFTQFPNKNLPIMNFFGDKDLLEIDTENISLSEALDLYSNFTYSPKNTKDLKKRFIKSLQLSAHKEIIDFIIKDILKQNTNYIYYINRKINLLQLGNFNEKVDVVNSLEDLLDNDNIFRLANGLNKYVAKYNVDKNTHIISVESLGEEFEDYLELRNIDNTVFISYYAFLLDADFFNASIEGMKFGNQIKATCSSSIFSKKQLKNEFIDYSIQTVKNELFQNMYEKNFQYQGIFEKEDSFFIDKKQTLIDCLKILSNTSRTEKHYSQKKIDIKKSTSYLKLTFLQRYQYSEQLDKTLKSKTEIQFDEIQKKNSDYKKYLAQKGFNSYEVKIIFNLLSQNKYKDLGIIYLSNFRQVDFFRFCYAFYFFDFFIEIKKYNFDTIKSFEIIFSFDNENDYTSDSLEQMRKYYLNMKQKTNKHYPFNNYEKNCIDIEKILRIDREKLKPILE